MGLVVGALESGGAVNASKSSMAPATMLVEFGLLDNVTAIIALETTCYFLPMSKLYHTSTCTMDTVPDHVESIWEEKEVFALAPCHLHSIQTQRAIMLPTMRCIFLRNHAKSISLMMSHIS